MNSERILVERKIACLLDFIMEDGGMVDGLR